MSKTMKKVSITTLGCKVNQYESEAISEGLEARGYEISSFEDTNFAYIINTCTVTAESDRKARQLIRRAIKKNPRAFILVCGCFAQTSPDAVAKIEGVDYIAGTANKMSLIDALCELDAQGHKNQCSKICVPPLDTADFEKMCISKFERTRAYVKIQDGCESRCTYCAIPGARGPVRSKAFSDVLDEVRLLTAGGCREIVLTGIETGSYGRDLEGDENLASLLTEIDKIQGIGRIRLGSLDPAIIKPAFVEKIKPLKSLTHHFHLSLQSGSDRVLASMKRKYNSTQAMRAITLLRDAFPDLQITTDVIVGFPGEDEEDFNKTVEFARAARFLMIHVFPYSKREGTPAATMKNQVDEQIKKTRVSTLSNIAENIRKEILDALMGQPQSVLFETYRDGFMYGHTREFIEVKVKSDKNLHAEVRDVKLISHDGLICLGELI